VIQLLTDTDLPAAAELLRRAGLPSAVVNVARYRRWQPDGVWGLFHGGALIGTVTLLQFGRVGFVGCMAVDLDRQGHGLGRRLLEHAHRAASDAGLATLLLEATASGRRLYEKLGYVAEYETAILSRDRVAASEPIAIADHRAAILALDRAATGSQRDVMIGDLLDHHRGGVERIADRDRGRGAELAGYGLAIGERLGPVIARDPAAGRALVERLAGACTIATVPVPNAAAMTAFTDAGFGPARTLHRMRRGAPLETRPAWLWGLASAGAG
jgi:GNAT superfamily N-acetyltransferase